jgi:hypothetical protein
MNLYSGGPNSTAKITPTIKTSFQLIAITGLQASVLITSQISPKKKRLFIKLLITEKSFRHCEERSSATKQSHLQFHIRNFA